MNEFYVTTAIPYVNAAPHLGHALELVQADVLARHRRLRGQPVRFLTGTDDNALKNVTAARKAGIDTAAFVDANAERFLALREPLQLSVDDAIRTSSARHHRGVEELWRRSVERGDFYRRSYVGRYCPGCEEFRDACDEHGDVVEEVAEENWFFRLSRYASQIRVAIQAGELRIEPVSRRNEVLAFLAGDVADISVSRPAARSGGWGIPVPGDADQVIYVWWDALANYVTALEGALLDQWWTGSAERVHVIGKGITRFHAVHWPALLLSAGLPLPTALAVHPYLSVDGAKIAKSSGATVEPTALVERFGADAVRWWLAREVGQVADTDFTVARLVDRANRELSNGLGNLVNRVVALAGSLHEEAAEPVADALPGLVDDALHRFDLRAATDAIWTAVEHGNRLVERDRPWELTGDARDAVLRPLLHLCRVLATECLPFVPDGAARLLGRLDGTRSGAAFPRQEIGRDEDRPGLPSASRVGRRTSVTH